MQLWDLDDLLQDSGNNLRSQAAAEDNDSNEMDVDINPPKSNKGTFSHSVLHVIRQWCCLTANNGLLDKFRFVLHR